MNFFGYQEQARKNSAILVGLFALAVVLITVAVYFAVLFGLMAGSMFVDNSLSRMMVVDGNSLWHGQLFFWTTLVTLAVILGGSAWRIHTLAEGGGAAVAEMLGGNRLPTASQGPLDRRLLNVVEEMAIASGLPVPPVYVLPQSGINAFAAGFTPSDAVIGITQGAIELLSRDQLQGVVAHEFSHILNGDSAMKMRMMGLLHGITLISDTGITLLTMKRTVRYSRDRGTHPALLVIGLLLFLVGTVGAVAADFIKRAVSRQREFLADASAVQFTRNPAGIAGALKIIGGYKEGSTVNHAATGQASHFFFGSAIKSWYRTDWWATHPPLVDRIRRIEPGFRGKFETVHFSSRSLENSAAAAAELVAAPEAARARGGITAEAVLSRVGMPDAGTMQEAASLLARMPARLRDFSHDPYTARAAVYALLLNSEAEKRKVQMQVLAKSADPNVFRDMLEIQPEVSRLDPELRLPLAELVMPALKEMSAPQYAGFRKSVIAMIKADRSISLFEFAVYRMVIRRLQAWFGKSSALPVKYHRIGSVQSHVAVVLALLARTGRGQDADAVFAEAVAMAGLEQLSIPEQSKSGLSEFDRALTELALASPETKERILQAAVHCVVYNGVISVSEGELLRVVADALECPLPPLLGV